jgi:hypothetical protein
MNAEVRQITAQINSGDQDHVYVIPIYQRTYTWGKKIQKLEDFLSIITNAFEQTDSISNRFIGFMVTVTPSNSGTIGRKEFVVVDGQQRITTISLIICALVNRLISKALIAPDDSEAQIQLKEKATSLFKKYIVLDSTPRKQGKILLGDLRFNPSKPDQETYLRVANNQPAPAGTPIGNAYAVICDFLKTLEKSHDGIEQFEDKVMTIMRSLTIVLLEIDRSKPGEAQSIFESINYRNAPLSPYDLIRNRVFMFMDERTSSDIYDTIWDRMENRYKQCFSRNSNEDTVPDHEKELLAFFHALLLKSGNKVPKADIYGKFLESIETADNSRPTKPEVQGFEEASKLYLFFRNPEWATTHTNDFGNPPAFYLELSTSEKKTLIRNLQTLSFLNIHSIVPFLMAMADQNAKGKEILEATDFFIALFIRIKFSGAGTQRMGDQMSGLVKAVNVMKLDTLRTKGVKKWMHDNLVSGGEPIFPADDDVIKYLKEKPVYKDGDYVKYVLHELSREPQGNGIDSIDADKLEKSITIDHVMCQSRSQAWLKYLQNQGCDTTEAIFNKHLHLIGNLALDSHNSKWKDSVYDQVYDDNGNMKASDMEKAFHWTTQEVPARFAQLNKETQKWGPWGYAQIILRTEDIARRIVATWKV